MTGMNALFAAALAFAGAASAQETTLNAVVFVPRNTTFGEIFVRFVDQVNKDGKGLVQIKLVGGPDAIPTFEQGNAPAERRGRHGIDPADVLHQCLPGVRRADPGAADDPATAQDPVLGRVAEIHQPEAQRLPAELLRRRHRLPHLDQQAAGSRLAQRHAPAHDAQLLAAVRDPGRDARSRPPPARCSPRSSAAWSTATAGRRSACSTSAGASTPSTASTPASTT